MNKYLLVNLTVLTEPEIAKMDTHQVILVRAEMLSLVKEYKRKFVYLFIPNIDEFQ